MKLGLIAFAGAALFLAAPAARAYCPSYTPAETAGGQGCGVEPAKGTNPTVPQWKAIFTKVAGGKASWGADGPDIGQMGAGCGKPTKQHNVDAHFPCAVLKAIAMQESTWQQFCVPDSPSQSVGAPERTIVAFDCGYGIGQVTTGMHAGENAPFDRQRVASDPTYNLAAGTLILRDKWAATSCVGDNDPDIVEDWYTAIWAYNGLAYSNNPNNPNLTGGRGPYNPNNGGSYTYQERVFGWMEHPPSGAHWPSLAVAYPNRGDLGTSGAPPEIPTPSCASPTSCAQSRPTHQGMCDGIPPHPPADGGAPPPPHDAGIDAPSPSHAIDAATIPEVDAGSKSLGTYEAPAPTAPQDAGGCACSTAADAGRSDGRAGLWLAAGAVVLMARRKRRTTARRI